MTKLHGLWLLDKILYICGQRINLRFDRIESIQKSTVNLTITCCIIINLIELDIVQPILNITRTSENNCNSIIGWVVGYVSFSTLRKIYFNISYSNIVLENSGFFNIWIICAYISNLPCVNGCIRTISSKDSAASSVAKVSL